MKFTINSASWEIKEVSKKELSDENFLGETDYYQQEIRIWNECKNKARTLRHELMHVWLWEYGHIQDEEFVYTYEEVCELMACSNDFINEVTEMYNKQK